MVDAAGHRDRVLIAGEVVSRGLRDEDPAHWQLLLRRALASGERPQCLCRGGSMSLPMVIATHGRTLVMKRMPNTGLDHHPDCESHGGHESRVAGIGKNSGALKPLAGGLLEAKLDVPLNTLTGAGRSSLGVEKKQEALPSVGVTRSAISLLDFLKLVWERAGLTSMPPGGAGRRLGEVYAKIGEELEELALGGRPARERVFVPDTRLDAQAMESKREELGVLYMQLQASASEGRRPVLLLIGEVRDLFPSRYGMGMRLKGMPDDRPVWLSRGDIADLLKSFPGVKSWMEEAAAGSGLHTKGMVIAGVQMSRDGNLNWVYGGWLDVGLDYLLR